MYAFAERLVARGEPMVDDIWEFERKDARTYLDRAFAHLFNGDYDGAEADYRMAICLNPADEDVKEGLARIGRVLCTMR